MTDSNIRSLTALRRLRRVETDESRRALAEALARQSTIVAREAAIRRDVEAARHATGDFDRESFTAWLARMRTERAGLAEAAHVAETQTAAARVDVSRRRLAETAAESALAVAMEAREAETARRDQIMLEDAARALKRASRPG